MTVNQILYLVDVDSTLLKNNQVQAPETSGCCSIWRRHPACTRGSVLVLDRMADLSDRIRSGALESPYRQANPQHPHGSHVGPVIAYEALEHVPLCLAVHGRN